jgi:hypothetical protein
MKSNLKFLLIGLGVILIVGIILLALSFEKIRYDEYVLLKNNFTHRLYYDAKYTQPGIYFIGIEKSFIKFPRYLIFNEFVGKSSIENSETFEKQGKLKVISKNIFILRISETMKSTI